MNSGKTIYNCAWITYGSQAVSLGIVPVASYVVRAHLDVLEGFNSDGSDEITIGHASDADAYAMAVSVNTTGVKTITFGSGIGYQETSREIFSYYTNSGSEPSTGKAFVALEFFLSPRNP